MKKDIDHMAGEANTTESIIDLKVLMCVAARDAAKELIKIAQEPIINGRLSGDGDDDGLSSDKLTRAAQAKKLAVMDCFEILDKVEAVENAIESSKGEVVRPTAHWAESNAKKRK